MAAAPNGARLRAWLALAAAIVALDQFTKWLVVERFAEGEGVVVTSFFNLVRHHNPGAAFSFLADSGGWQRWLFTGIGIVAAVVIVWMLKKHPTQTLFCLAVTLILGGAVGNVIDRVLWGHVVDFIQVHWRGASFPTFNIADSAITAGAVALILDELRRVRRAPR